MQFGCQQPLPLGGALRDSPKTAASQFVTSDRHRRTWSEGMSRTWYASRFLGSNCFCILTMGVDICRLFQAGSNGKNEWMNEWMNLCFVGASFAMGADALEILSSYFPAVGRKCFDLAFRNCPLFVRICHAIGKRKVASQLTGLACLGTILPSCSTHGHASRSG